MWIAIWLCFAAFVLVFVGWTLVVLFQQKKAWSAYARRYKLKYEPGTFMGSPVVTGDMAGRIFSLYTGVQQTDDIRGQRYVTVIEFQMGKGMPTGAAIATKEFAGFINGLIFNEIMTPELAEWDSSFVVRTRDKKNLQAYFTKERQRVLQSLFVMKGAAVLFFFDEIEAVLRIETSDPLRDEQHLGKIIKRIQDAVEILAPSADEKKLFRKLLEEERARDDDEDENGEKGEVEIVEDVTDTPEEDDPAPPTKKKKKKASAKKKKSQSKDE